MPALLSALVKGVEGLLASPPEILWEARNRKERQ